MNESGNLLERKMPKIKVALSLNEEDAKIAKMLLNHKFEDVRQMAIEPVRLRTILREAMTGAICNDVSFRTGCRFPSYDSIVSRFFHDMKRDDMCISNYQAAEIFREKLRKDGPNREVEYASFVLMYQYKHGYELPFNKHTLVDPNICVLIGKHLREHMFQRYERFFNAHNINRWNEFLRDHGA